MFVNKKIPFIINNSKIFVCPTARICQRFDLLNQPPYGGQEYLVGCEQNGIILVRSQFYYLLIFYVTKRGPKNAKKKKLFGAFELWQMNLRNFLCIFLLQNLHLSYTERQQSFVAHIWKQLQEEDPLKLCFFDANFVVCLLDSFMFLKIENVSNFLIKNALTMNHSQSPVFLRKKPLLR